MCVTHIENDQTNDNDDEKQEVNLMNSLNINYNVELIVVVVVYGLTASNATIRTEKIVFNCLQFFILCLFVDCWMLFFRNLSTDRSLALELKRIVHVFFVDSMFTVANMNGQQIEVAVTTATIATTVLSNSWSFFFYVHSSIRLWHATTFRLTSHWYAYNIHSVKCAFCYFISSRKLVEIKVHTHKQQVI